MTRQSVKVTAPSANATIKFGDESVIHVGEVIKVKINFEIEDEIEDGSKLIIQTNKDCVARFIVFLSLDCIF